MRRALLLWLALTVFSPALTAADTPQMTATPVALDPTRPALQTVGALTWRAGFILTSPSPHFGGISALAFGDEPQILHALTDHGYWVRFALEEESGTLTGLRLLALDPMLSSNGSPLRRGTRDAEALVIDTHGQAVVAFERTDQLSRFPMDPTPGQMAATETLPPMPKNKGIEALTPLADGRLLLLSEGNSNGPAPAWIREEDGTLKAFAYEVQDRFHPTEAKTLSTGDVLILTRHFTILDGVAIRLERLRGGDIKPGATLKGEILAELRPPLTIDNMEGLAIREDEAGITLYMISDDNFSPLQRTLLLQFDLVLP